jgi:N-acetylneuraminic acid mutarotase
MENIRLSQLIYPVILVAEKFGYSSNKFIRRAYITTQEEWDAINKVPKYIGETLEYKQQNNIILVSDLVNQDMETEKIIYLKILL